jgi:hypothetical protein
VILESLSKFLWPHISDGTLKIRKRSWVNLNELTIFKKLAQLLAYLINDNLSCLSERHTLKLIHMEEL